MTYFKVPALASTGKAVTQKLKGKKKKRERELSRLSEIEELALTFES